MKHQSELSPFRFAWRGLLGGTIGPMTCFLVFSNPRRGACISFLLLVVVFIGGGIGAISGFIIGLLYKDGLEIGCLHRLAVSLGLSLGVLLVFVILFVDGKATTFSWVELLRNLIIGTLILGSLPAVATSPWLFSSPKEKVQ